MYANSINPIIDFSAFLLDKTGHVVLIGQWLSDDIDNDFDEKKKGKRSQFEVLVVV